MIMAMTKKADPDSATYLRPSKSDREPTKGQIAAKASKLARINQTHRSVPPMSRYMRGGMPPKRYAGICEPVQRKAMATKLPILL